MYQTLALHDDSGNIVDRTQIFSVDTIRESRVETLSGHKTSRRTLLVCSLILIATAGLLATWVFVSKPSFYPKINLFSRSLNDKDINKNDLINAHAYSSIIRTRRNIDIYRNATQELVVWKVDFTQNTDSELTIEFVNDPSLFPTNDSRLPTDLLPENYRVALNIDLEKDSYNGSVKMSLKCVNNTKRIIFHGRRLILTRVKIKHDKNIMEYKKITYIKRFDMYVIDFEDPGLMKNNTYELQVDYYVTYGKSLAGLYKSNYTTQDKKQRKIVSSHFEPIDARSAFPCLDEPSFKATFDISITHLRNLTALSNMPIKETVHVDNETVQDNFETTVRMSTYLVAFSVNDFLYKERTTASGIKVRVYAKADDYTRIDYPLMAAATIISFYEEYFQIRYPLPKLDLLAVPEFMAGAMEDWGLVSFRSAYLVYDDQVMTPESLRQVTLVIAHELAHQWFGNLVTMKWWNDIWLNEGFANFVEMIGTNEVNKQFHSLKIQVPTGWQSAISLDSLKNTHAVSPDVKKDSEIDELFDTISYNKGASLLRMVEGFMGDNLIEGVRNYLNEYKYSNAATDDLWKHLSNTSKDHLEIKEIMDTWTKQPSFPIITMLRTNGSFVIRQEAFLQAKSRVDNGGTLMNTSSEGDKWIVPFTYITSENKDIKTVWMKDREMVLNISSDVKWIKANMDSMGFYVVNYDNETWSGLQKQLMDDHELEIKRFSKSAVSRRIKKHEFPHHLDLAYDTVFTPVNRAGILHDALKLSCELMIEPSIPLDLMRYAKKENSLIPWSMIRSKHECLTLMVNEKELKQKYKRYVWQLQSHLVNESMLHQNITNGTSLTLFERVQRMETFSFGLKNNITKDFKTRLEEIFDDMVQYGDRLPGLSPEIRALAITYGHDSFKDSHWDFLWKLYVNSPVDTDRKIIMKAFALYKDKTRVNQMLEKSLDTNTIRVQDTIPFISIIVKISSRKQVWDYVTKNYQKFKDRYSGGYHLGQLLGEIAGGFTKEEELKEVKAFLKTHPVGSKGSRTEKQIIEKIENSIRRHSTTETNLKYSKAMKEWLEAEAKRTI